MKGPPAHSDPPSQLVRAAARGDEASLLKLLREVSPPVRQWALAYTGSPDDAADLVQEVLLLLVRKISSYRGEARFLSWLFAITRNQALEARRKEGRNQRKMTRWIGKARPDPLLPPSAGTDVDRKRIGAVVSAFLSELPRRQREVFQLSELQGLTSPEIGKILGLDPGSVRAALFKARRTLRRRILRSHRELVEEYLP